MKKKSILMVWCCLLLGTLLIVGCGNSSGDDDSNKEDIPDVQDVEPIISAIEIGVPDLAAATAFYRDTIGMEVLSAGEYPDYLNEDGVDVVVLATLEEGRRGSLLVLMNDPSITDPAYYTDNPDKLVFRVPDAQAFYDGILSAGGREVGTGGAPPEQRYPQYPNLLVGLVYSPNGYLIEMLQVPDELAGNIPCNAPYITGVGIGVSDLDLSQDFFTRVLGMVFREDIPVEGFMNEKQLVTPSGATPSIVLMNYITPKDYSDNPVKLVFQVDDAKRFFNYIEAVAPDRITSPLETGTDGTLSGYAQDLDGTMIQVVEAPNW